MAKIYTSYFTSDEVELKFDTEYRFIENEKNNNFDKYKININHMFFFRIQL